MTVPAGKGPTAGADARAESDSPNDAARPAAALEIRDLVVTYGKRRAVDGLSLSVAPGEIVGMLAHRVGFFGVVGLALAAAVVLEDPVA